MRGASHVGQRTCGPRLHDRTVNVCDPASTTQPDAFSTQSHFGQGCGPPACRMGLEGIVSKRLGSRYRSGRSPDWLKFKNPAAPAVKREAEEHWGKERWR